MTKGIVVTPRADHYGPVSIGMPDKKVKDQCRHRGQRVAELAKRLVG